MSNTLNKLKLEFKSLEQRFKNLDKSNNNNIELIKTDALNLLSILKRNQDKLENKAFENDYEDLVYEVIDIVGQL